MQASTEIPEGLLSPIMAKRTEEHFAAKRQIVLWGPVDDNSARRMVEQLYLFDSEDAETPIEILIHSPGGSTAAGMAVLDAMDWIRPPVATTCLGIALSFGAVILASGATGHRSAAPRSRIMIHQPWVSGKIQGRPFEILRHAKEIQHTRQAINSVLSERTGQPPEVINEDTDRDFWMSAKEAVAYGLIDKVHT